MVKFSLKVGKDTLEIQQTAEQSFEDFQAKVFTLTDIPPKNLKLLVKGKMIRDNKELLQHAEGTQIIVMGTKTGNELKSTGNIKIETLIVEEPKMPTRYGITNIGNTCYMNAAIQFLRSIPEFDKLVRSTKLTNPASINQQITVQAASVFRQLDQKDVVPKHFVALFLNVNPQFTPFGQQFDSDQFMQKFLNCISGASPEHSKTIRDMFQIQMQEITKNKEIEDEPEKVEYLETMKLCCSLGGVQKQIKVGTLKEGIKLSLEGDLEKMSPVDNINHLYHKKSRFNKLPNYLLVQEVRFFWKQAEDAPGSKSVATKICKSIDFGIHLDVFDFCTSELQKELEKGREALEINKKKDEEQYKRQYQEYKNSLGDTSRPQTRIIEEFREKWKKQQSYLKEGLQTGMYQMRAVVTHLGHSVESGHYMAWVKETEDDWMKYDDDSVYAQPEAKVMQLRGGQPNLEIAYLILFRKVFTKPI